MIRRTSHIIRAVRGRTTLEAALESKLDRFILYTALLARQGARQLVAHRAPLMAAALAYRTIFSLVPMLALALVVLNAFYQQEGVEVLFQKIFEWTGISEIHVEGERLADHLETYIATAADKVSEINFGIITVFGLALLIYAALSLVIQIETAFNTICRAPRGRRVLIRLTSYWTILTLGSLGLVLSFVVGQSYAQMIENVPPWAAWATFPLRLFTRLGVTWIILLVAYRLLPNTRVAAKYAAVGAAVAAVLWEIAKSALTWFVIEVTAGKVQIYGSLAILPLFLLWIYFTWLIVLFGLEVTSAMQSMTREDLDRISAGRPEPVTFDPADVLIITARIARAFNDGRALAIDEIRTGIRANGDAVNRCLRQLVQAGFLHAVSDDHDENAWALARPPESVLVAELLDAGYRLKEAADTDQDTRAYRALLARAAGNTTLADFLDRDGLP